MHDVAIECCFLRSHRKSDAARVSYTYSVRPLMSSIDGMHEASVQRETDRVTCTPIAVRGYDISEPNSTCVGALSRNMCLLSQRLHEGRAA
jgi:hypothetical protein